MKENLKNIQSAFYKELLFTILPNLKEAVLLVDASFCLVYMNKKAEKLTGLNLKDLKGKPVNKYVTLFEENRLSNILEPSLKDKTGNRQGKRIYADTTIVTNSFTRRKIGLLVIPLTVTEKNDPDFLLILTEKPQSPMSRSDSSNMCDMLTGTLSLIDTLQIFNNFIEKITDELKSTGIDAKNRDYYIKQLCTARELCRKINDISVSLAGISKKNRYR